MMSRFSPVRRTTRLYRRALFSPLLAGVLAVGCSPNPSRDTVMDAGESSTSRDEVPSRRPAVDGARASETQELDPRRAVVALGDSLTAGYGISADEAYPARLQQRIDAQELPYKVVNAGVSGDTTAGGRRRLGWALGDHDVAVLIVALGGNDGLRGLSVEQMQSNLASILEQARSRDIRVLLTGMEAPPNNGPRYAEAFRGVFSDLADEYDVAFFPFLLKDVAGIADLNQRDGIHPNPAGVEVLADNLWEYLLPMLDSLQAGDQATPATTASDNR